MLFEGNVHGRSFSLHGCILFGCMNDVLSGFASMVYIEYLNA